MRIPLMFVILIEKDFTFGVTLFDGLSSLFIIFRDDNLLFATKYIYYHL